MLHISLTLHAERHNATGEVRPHAFHFEGRLAPITGRRLGLDKASPSRSNRVEL